LLRASFAYLSSQFVRFTEKPALAVAQGIMSPSATITGIAGMFFWRVSKFLDKLQRHLPKNATRWISRKARYIH